MKYTKKQLFAMIKDYFFRLGDVLNFCSEEQDGMLQNLRECRFTFMENCLWDWGHTREDLVFLLIGNIDYYQVFAIEEEQLVPLHQAHHVESCLTCIGEERKLADQEARASQPF